MKIIDSDAVLLKTVGFEIPTEIYGAPLRNEAEVDGRHAKKHASRADDKKYSITVDLPEGAHKIELFDTENRLVDERAIPATETRPKKVKVKKIRGSEFLRKKEDSGASPSLRRLEGLATRIGDSIVGKAYTQAATAEGGVVFIGDKYADSDTDRSRFDSDVDRVIGQLLALAPFDCHAERFVFYRVPNSTPLGCTYSTVNERLLLCDDSKVTTAVNDAEIAYDHIAVLVNSSTYGGSGGSIPVSYNGPDGPLVLAHEFGHTFAGLRDEYVLYESLGHNANQVDKNCYGGSPPADEWNGVVEDSSYYLECNYENWYRSSSTSLMRTLDADRFNLVSRNIIERKIETAVGPFSEPGPCSVSEPPSQPSAPTLLFDSS